MLMLKRVMRRLKRSHARKPPRSPDRYQDTLKYLSGSQRLRVNFPQAETDFDPPAEKARNAGALQAKISIETCSN